MSWVDYTVVIVYLVVVAAIGLSATGRQESTRKYFLADKQMPQWAIGFTLMATLISSNTLVAHPGIVYQKSMILVPGFMVMPLVLIFVALYVVPFYRRVVGMSAYEYIGRRFGLGGRLYTSFGFLMSRTFGIGTAPVTTSIAVNVMTGWDIGAVIVGIGAFTAAYTLSADYQEYTLEYSSCIHRRIPGCIPDNRRTRRVAPIAARTGTGGATRCGFCSLGCREV